MYQETTGHEVVTKDVKGEVRKQRGLTWAIISFAIIALTIIIGVFFAINFAPNPEKITAPSNSSSAPVQK